MKDAIREQVVLTLAAMSGQEPTFMEKFERAVDHAEANVKPFVYRCRECTRRGELDVLDPDEDLIFRDGNHFYCVRHKIRGSQAMHCAVKGCTNKPIQSGTLCKYHQVELGAFGDLGFEEER